MVCMPLKAFKKSLKIPKGYQNTSIEGQTAQWPNEKRKEQTSIKKHTHKTKDRVTRTYLVFQSFW